MKYDGLVMPLIQLSVGIKGMTVLVYIFHEAGHIILREKDIFLEDVTTLTRTWQEEEANSFAIKWTLSNEQEEEIVQRYSLTEDDVLEFAEPTPPAIIIGRLHHKNYCIIQ